jgi:hypothetical protein
VSCSGAISGIQLIAWQTKTVLAGGESRAHVCTIVRSKACVLPHLHIYLTLHSCSSHSRRTLKTPYPNSRNSSYLSRTPISRLLPYPLTPPQRGHCVTPRTLRCDAQTPAGFIRGVRPACEADTPATRAAWRVAGSRAERDPDTGEFVPADKHVSATGARCRRIVCCDFSELTAYRHSRSRRRRRVQTPHRRTRPRRPSTAIRS